MCVGEKEGKWLEGMKEVFQKIGPVNLSGSSCHLEKCKVNQGGGVGVSKTVL